MVGLSSGGLEDCSLSQPGLYQLLHQPFRLHSVSLKAYRQVDGSMVDSLLNFNLCGFFLSSNVTCCDRFRRRELHLPTALEPESIFQAELESFLGSKTDSQDCIDKDADKSLSGK